MSDSAAPRSIVAVGGLGSIPFWRKRSTTSVAVEPTGSNVARDRDPRLDRADVVVVEDLHDLGLLDADHALGLLGVVDEHDPARGRAHEVGARDQPDRVPVGVDGDRGAVVDVLDRLGDVGDEVVGADGQRLGVHERPARRRQRDHPGRDVGVERGDDDRRACSRAKPTISSDGRLPLLTIRSDAPSSMASRCASARLPTTTASPGAIFVGASTCHRVHPHPARDARGRARR